MNTTAIQKVCREVATNFPQTKNVAPVVSSRGGGRYTLVFSYSSKLPDGHSLHQSVRVVADEQGTILKTSSTRG